MLHWLAVHDLLHLVFGLLRIILLPVLNALENIASVVLTDALVVVVADEGHDSNRGSLMIRLMKRL